MSWYYLSATGDSLGPLSLEALMSLIDSGQVSPNALVWKPGMSDWAPAKTVPGLLQPPPPPLAPRTTASVHPHTEPPADDTPRRAPTPVSSPASHFDLNRHSRRTTSQRPPEVDSDIEPSPSSNSAPQSQAPSFISREGSPDGTRAATTTSDRKKDRLVGPGSNWILLLALILVLGLGGSLGVAFLAQYPGSSEDFIVVNGGVVLALIGALLFVTLKHPRSEDRTFRYLSYAYGVVPSAGMLITFLLCARLPPYPEILEAYDPAKMGRSAGFWCLTYLGIRWLHRKHPGASNALITIAVGILCVVSAIAVDRAAGLSVAKQSESEEKFHEGFGTVVWGASREEVKRAFPTALEETGNLAVESSIDSNRAMVQFLFHENKLWGVCGVLYEVASDLSMYERVRTELTRQYGQPKEARQGALWSTKETIVRVMYEHDAAGVVVSIWHSSLHLGYEALHSRGLIR